MAFTASFTNRYVFVIDVTYLTNSCHTQFYWNVSPAHRMEVPVSARLPSFCHQLKSHDTSCTSKLCALTWVKLNVVDEGTNRDVCQRRCVTGLDVTHARRFDYVANFQTVWAGMYLFSPSSYWNQSDVSGSGLDRTQG